MQTEAAKVKGLLLTQKKSFVKVAQNQLLEMLKKKIVHPLVQRICEISVCKGNIQESYYAKNLHGYHG